MNISFVFWLLMILWLVFGFVFLWPLASSYFMGGSALQFILLALLGWKTFGSPIQRG